MAKRLLLLVKDTKFESKSQHVQNPILLIVNCFYWSKIQNLKANHNYHLDCVNDGVIAFIGQRYKIWKQITTNYMLPIINLSLLLLVKDTKFESKSQQLFRQFYWWANCFYWSKIQNLKANHNNIRVLKVTALIAFIGQRYKIWKQITTMFMPALETLTLLLLVKDTKFESKSQRIAEMEGSRSDCFYWSKIQNLKANHNNDVRNKTSRSIAFIGQRYKIWKQITTIMFGTKRAVPLLLLVKDTKFESKSQLILCTIFREADCFYWSKIQNLKANHNS